MFISFVRTATLIAIVTSTSAGYTQEMAPRAEPMPMAPQGLAAPQTYTMPNTPATALSPTQLPSAAPAPTVVLPPPPAQAAEPAHADAPRCWCHVVNPGSNTVERTKCGFECCRGDSADDGC